MTKFYIFEVEGKPLGFLFFWGGVDFKYGVNFWKYYSGNNVEKALTWDRETARRFL